MAAGQVKFFGRAYKLELDGVPYETKEGLPAMDIKFDVTYAIGQTCRFGTVSILGLSHQTMSKYLALSAMPTGKALSEMMTVKLSAGYDSESELTEIINGYAYYATVDAPPNMWLTLKVSEVNPTGGPCVDVAAKQAPTIESYIRGCLEKFSAEEGVAEEFDFVDYTPSQVCSKKKTMQYGLMKKINLRDFIAKLNDMSDWNVKFILRGNLLEAYGIDREETVEKVIDVDGNNGLLAVSGIDAVNGDITTFLSYQDERLCYLHLTSQLNPQANGRYIIVRKQHLGHYNGNEWYTKYHCSARAEDEELEQ